MWNQPTEDRLAKIPRLYETEKIPLKDKEIHLHFFFCGSDWYIVEFDQEDTFFGSITWSGKTPRVDDRTARRPSGVGNFLRR